MGWSLRLKVTIVFIVSGAGLFFIRPIISDMWYGKFASIAGGRSATAAFFPDAALKLLQESLQSYGNQISATIEKQTVAAKEELQADLNQQATSEAVRGGLLADEKFGSSESISSMCAVAEDQSSAMNAKISSDLWAKAIVKTNLDGRLAAPDPSIAVDRSLSDHYSNYCSDHDSLQGRCSANGNGLQNADVNVSTMLEPNFAMTLSDEEYRASLAAAKKIVGPVQPHDVPVAMERTPYGKDYLMQKRIGQAALSLADHTFAQVIARRRSREDPN